jgi:hypothetical protein
MAKKKKGGKPKRRTKGVIHLLPAISEIGGLLEPAFIQNKGGDVGPALGQYAIDLLKGNTDGYPANLTFGNTMDSYISGWEYPVGGIIIGEILKWVGKKTGLNKVGTKKVKIL